MTLGEKLLQLRKSKGLSQEQLAVQITVSRQAISKWELGEAMPDTDNVVQLSKIFNVSTDYLLNDNYGEGTDAENEASSITITNELPRIDVNVEKSNKSTQKIIGFIFLGVGLIAFVILLSFADSLAALIIGVPLIVCGIMCLVIKRHVVLWCGWVVFLLFYTFFAIASGSGFLWLFQSLGKRTGFMALPLAILLIITGRLVYKKSKRQIAND